MGVYFRRLIAQKIVRLLQRQQSIAENEAAIFEKNVASVVKTRRVCKPCQAQFTSSLSGLADVMGVQAVRDICRILPQIQDNDIVSCSVNNTDLLIGLKNDDVYQRIIGDVSTDSSRFGSTILREFAVQTAVVEYSSPNIAKPFHAGHLRSTIIGNFIANLYEFVGHRVHRINYLGDWGTQFGLLLLGFQQYGNQKLLCDDPLFQLYKIYVAINQGVEDERVNEKSDTLYQQALDLFSKLENGDPSLVSLWTQFRDLSLQEYSRMYERLGVSFTETQFESQFSSETQRLTGLLRARGLLKTDENGVGYVAVDNVGGTSTKAKLVKSDGSSLYLSRDVSAALERHERLCPDIVHYVVEGAQQLHFKHLTGILQQLGLPWAQGGAPMVHVPFGRIEGMSSRRGAVVFLKDILDEARDKMLQCMMSKSTTRVDDLENVADTLAVSSVIVQDLKGCRRSQYTFSWDRMLRFSGDTGVFLQYTHARLCSLLSVCGFHKTDAIDVSCLTDVNIHRLLLTVNRYPEVIEDALSDLEPCTVVQYLFNLCRVVNSAYTTCPVKGRPIQTAQTHLLVFDCARQVLSNGMHLVGLKPLHQM